MIEFEDSARQAQTVAELDTIFGREVRRLGFTAYAAGYVPGGQDADDVARDPFLLINWPRSWLELYAREGFAQDDAVVAAALHATEPFTWGDIQTRQPGASARIFAAARDFGWNDGLLVPVRSVGGERCIGVVSLAAPSLQHLGRAGRAEVASRSLLAFALAEDLARAGRASPTLTAREQGALSLVAKGCDDAEIAKVLGVSKATAHHYVERAKQRLGATTRAQAVALALTRGLLDLER